MNTTFACHAGTFSGYETEACIHVRGIRYARSERYGAPEPYHYGEGVQECIDPSPFAVQLDSGLEKYLTGLEYDPLLQEESCQYLSITLPKGPQESLLPVMVWFHGGGFHHGGCDSDSYNYEYLSAEQNVILVGVNYRLGVLGFGRTKQGGFSNNGLLDAIESLRWIQENITSFGGDPENVTIFGQSAGAYLCRCIMLANGTEHLYRRAILQSDPIGTMKGREEMEQKILDEVMRLPADADLDSIREVEASVLSHVTEKGNAKYMVFGPHFGIYPLPSIDDIELRTAEIAETHELLTGSATREVAVYGGQIRALVALDAFPLTEKLIEAIMKKLSESIFIKPIEQFAKMYALAGGTVYLYSFYWRENHAYIGAGHMIDLGPLFGGQAIEGRDPAMGLCAEEIAEKGKPMRAIWASFARTGVPESYHVPGMLSIQKL